MFLGRLLFYLASRWATIFVIISMLSIPNLASAEGASKSTNSRAADLTIGSLSPALQKLCSTALLGVEAIRFSPDGRLLGIEHPLGEPAPALSEYKHGGQLSIAPIRNQRAYGGCVTHCTLGMLETLALARGHDVQLSADYVIYKDLYEKASLALEMILMRRAVDFPAVSPSSSDGAIRQVLQKHGVISEQAWQPRVRFGVDAESDERFIATINGLIQRTQELIVEENYQFGLATDVLAKLQKRFALLSHRILRGSDTEWENGLRQLQNQLRSLEVPGLDSIDLNSLDQIKQAKALIESHYQLSADQQLSHTSYKNELSVVKAEVLSSIETIFNRYLGTPPKSFKWNGTEYKPRQFFNQPMFGYLYLPSHPRHAVSAQRFKESPTLFEKLLTDTIDAREPVYASFNWARVIAHEQGKVFPTGIVSFDHFNPLQLSTTQLQDLEPSRYLHAIYIVDYKLDANGAIDWVLIKNSWGTGVGMSGYFHVKWKTFLQYAGKVVLPTPTENGLYTIPIKILRGG